jgi:DNA-binding transcriptional LysR family regulator
MQLEALKIFCDVVRWASFSRGAAENGISQSSASQAVHQLEVRLGVKLIDRSKRPLVPTEHGRLYYEGVKDLIGRYFELEARVKALSNDRNVVGNVTVASIYSVGLAHMSRYVERFQRAYPGAKVRLEYLHPTRVVEAVQDGTAELGLISYPKKWADLAVIPWREEEMVVAAHPSHPFASQGSVELGQLDGEAFVAFDADLAIRRNIDRFLRKHGIAVEVAMEFDNIEHIKRAVEIPAGVAILPRPTLDREVAAGTLAAVPFRDHRPTRPLAILHRGGGQLGLPASRFLDLLRRGGDEPAEAPAVASASAEDAAAKTAP